MKFSSLLRNTNRNRNTFYIRFFLISGLLFVSAQSNWLQAQAKLSIQGILKKAGGEAVPDDQYALTFRLYTVPSGPISQAIWTETQNDVEVVSGIYSTVLGNTTALNVPFNADYYLGVSVGSTEMTPRIQLTSAPYALSLRGQTNQFPSSGQVIADSVKVSWGVTARGGVPVANGRHNGYTFSGNNGDTDSGLASTTNGQVGLYVNNAVEVDVRPDSVVINGEIRPENIRLDSGGKISYNGLNDWRLVETDYFENTSDAEGWKVYNPVPVNGVSGAWSNGSGTGATVTNFSDDFAGRALVPTAQGQVFKKQYTLPGSAVAGTYTYVKVVFKYFYLNSWDLAGVENGWAAFSKTENCTELSVGWFNQAAYVSAGNNLGNNSGQFGPAANFVNGSQNGPTQYSDQWTDEEMTARYPSGPNNSSFYVIFGNANDEAVGTENWGVGMIEIWVK